MSSTIGDPTNQAGKSPAIAALATAVLPGLGHVYAGLRRVGITLLIVDVLVAGGLSALATRDPATLVSLIVEPTGLALLVGTNIALLGYRTVAIIHAQRAVSPGAGRMHLGPGPLIALVVVLLAPHAAVGYLTYLGADLVDSVFPTVTEPVAAASTTVVISITSGTTTSTAAPPPVTTTTTVLFDGLDRLNILLLGADAGVGRTGVRTDTIIVVSVDPVTGDTAMFSVPRDLSNAPLPEGMGLWECRCFPDLITHLWDSATRYPDAYPGPGEPTVNAVKGAVGEILGIPIHYYAMVDLEGFVAVVDAFGGVTIDVPQSIIDETYPHENGGVESVVIPAGVQHLDGHLALAYARIRRHSDDFARMHRQRCVLGALVDQTGPFELVARFRWLAEAIKNHVTTDIPKGELPDLVEVLGRVDTERISTLRITRVTYQIGYAPGRVFYDMDRIRRDVELLIGDPQSAQLVLGLTPLDTTCEESFD